LARTYLPAQLRVEPEEIYVVSVMPCTAKKFEATRNEFVSDGRPDVDAVITTQELARMIREAGVRFDDLPVEPFDLPMGMATGAGMIFGNTGGVAEAVLRAASDILEPNKAVGAGSNRRIVFDEVRGVDGVREASLTLGGREVRLAVAHSLGAAAQVLERIKSGEAEYDLVEIMACPGGCLGGGGQPIPTNPEIRQKRTEAIYAEDADLPIRKSHMNPEIQKLYNDFLKEPLGELSHQLLHTTYTKRERY